MTKHPNVSATEWPVQGGNLGRRVNVAFSADDEWQLGTIVRDDMEDPFLGLAGGAA